MKPEAPVLHDDPKSYPRLPGCPRWRPTSTTGRRASPGRRATSRQGFAESDRVFEHSFRIPSRHQGYLEPYASVVDIDQTGRVAGVVLGEGAVPSAQPACAGGGDPGGVDPGQRRRRRRRLRREGRCARPAHRLSAGEAGGPAGEDHHEHGGGADGLEPEPPYRRAREDGRDERRPHRGAQAADAARVAAPTGR